MTAHRAPTSYSRSEQAQLSFQLTYARMQVEQFQGEIRAPWLLNDADEPYWLLRTPSARQWNGTWRGAHRIDWSIRLPDDTLLTDACNIRCLDAVKRACFLVRHIDSFGISNTKSHVPFISDVIGITRWLHLHRNTYCPHEHGFSLINESDVFVFMNLYLEGGMAWALGYPQQLCQHFYRAGLNMDFATAGDRVFDLPPAHLRGISDWLAKNDYYIRCEGHRTSPSYLSRDRIAALLRTESNAISTEKFSAFLRQFEPDMLAISSTLLIPASQFGHEFFSHRTRKLKDVEDSPVTLSSGISLAQSWLILCRLHHHDPSNLPALDRLSGPALKRYVVHRALPNEATPWVPLEIALKYTREALRWVIMWGSKLVDFYLEAITFFTTNKMFNRGSNETMKGRRRQARDEWVRANIPSELKDLQISGFRTCFHQGQKDRYNAFRRSPGLVDAIETLLGAIIVLLATVKPIRFSEILSLEKDCLVYVKNDGYYLRHTIAKRGIEDQTASASRPIPAIVADAIQLAITIGERLKKLAEEQDPFALRKVFYYSPPSRADITPHLPTEKVAYAWVDLFCDYVNLPPDEFGRRWYFRTHEGRKSFLITFFWLGKYSSLGALSWMAGHASWEQTIHYIRANFPGDELPTFEAEYATMQLWNFEQKKPVETRNISELYRLVCESFHVTEIGLIPEKDLMKWLTIAFRQGDYEIRPISATAHQAIDRIEFAFLVTHRGGPNASAS